MTITERLQALREVMQQEHLGAFIFPSTDAHQSEYVADFWKGRQWISGFTGSAGTIVVTQNAAALWTDSRYFIAAEKQLAGTGIQLMRLRQPETPTMPAWIATQCLPGSEIGIDGTVWSYADTEQLIADLRAAGGMTLRVNFDPLQRIWKDRPALPNAPIVCQPLQYADETTASKLQRIREKLAELHCDGMLISALDDIAWTLNLRGTDVHCTPVFVAYLLLENEKTTLFVADSKLSPEVRAYLESEHIAVKPYDAIASYLKKDYFAYNLLLDPHETNSYLVACAKPNVAQIVFRSSPIPRMKAIKNAAEIAGFHEAMRKDGVAMVKFLKWVDENVAREALTELSLSQKLHELRAAQPLFKDISFDSIVAYEAHGAIVHYTPTATSNARIMPHGFVLIDSGAQYQDGTTDITRTIALGPISDEQTRIYTLVLKAHIQLSLAVFPQYACGTQIDALAREPLWRAGYNFLHGTGHGVGAYLSVHEGPQQVRMEYNATPLEAGMTITNEPGIYVENAFGVRIENTMLIEQHSQTPFGTFLCLKPLTLCPIDTRPICTQLLTNEELQWINDYHQHVYKALSPTLNDDEQAWLAKATAPISVC